jgi:CheY-like chemotaxis protein
MTAAEPRPFTIFWIEDEYEKLSSGVDQVKAIIESDLASKSKVDIRSTPTLDDAKTLLDGNTAPDVILLDVMLPRTRAALQEGRVDQNGGYLVWHWLREGELRARLGSIPIVVVTCHAACVFRPKMEGDPNLIWLNKPVAPQRIAEAIMASCPWAFEKHHNGN